MLLTNTTMAGRKKTKSRRRMFLFMVMEFLTNKAAMLVREGKTMVEEGFFLSDLWMRFWSRVSDSF